MEQKLTIHEKEHPVFTPTSFWPTPLFMNPMTMDPLGWSSDFFDITHRNMSQMFDGFFGNWPGIPHSHPFAHVTDDEKSIHVKMDVPAGLDAKDIDISANDGLLTITASKRNQDSGTQGIYSFSFSIDLPENINIDRANVSLSHQKLNINIPKGAQPVKDLPAKEKQAKTQAATPATSMKNDGHRKEKQHP